MQRPDAPAASGLRSEEGAGFYPPDESISPEAWQKAVDLIDRQPERWQWLAAIEERACNAKDGSSDARDVLAGDVLALVRELRKLDPTTRRPA